MIKVGICGLGFMGKTHAACYSNIPGVKIAAVADVRQDIAKTVAGPHGAATFSTAKDLIAHADIDAVDICLPTYLHCEHIVLAARRGLDCLCEKPMALSVAEATRMVKAVRAAQVKFMVAHVIRFWPEYQVLKEYVDKKKLGALKELFCRRFGARMPGWRNWFTKGKLSGGAALDLHIHDADFIRYLLGDPKSLDSVGVLRRGSWDQISTNYHYPNLAVNATGGWWLAESEPFDMAFRAVFEKGVLAYSSRFEPLTCCAPGRKGVALDVPKPKTGRMDAGGNISSLGGYFNEVQYFVNCLQAGRHPEVVTPEDARDSLVLIFREIASATRKLKK